MGRFINDVRQTQGRQFVLKLVEAGLTREQAYKAVQDNAMWSWKTGEEFRDLLENDKVISSKVKKAQIEDIFNPEKVFKNIDYIFKNTGIK